MAKKKITKKKATKKKATRKKPTSIRCGTSREQGGAYIGKKVDQIRKELQPALNIPSGARSHANGEPVNRDYVLKQGDVLEFIKTAGRHG